MADLDTPQVKFREKLVHCGNNSSLYKSGFYPHIRLIITDDNIITAECNDIDIDTELLSQWFIEVDGNLDDLMKRIDDKYGELAPGFENSNEKEEMDNNRVEPIFRDLKYNPNRELTIYTWGKKHREYRPSQSQCNFNAGTISSQIKGMNLKNVTGLNYDIQQSIKIGSGYIELMRSMINKIENEDLHSISINCTAGRHRSVACAEILKREFYPNTTIHHLELNRVK